MKKCMLTICLAMVSFGVFAQIPSIGIKGGLNFATFASSDGGTSMTSNSITTFNAGVFVDLKFGNISLQPALNYTGKGGSYSETLVTPGGSGVTEVEKDNLYYLQLPVNLVFHIPVIVGNIYFGAGPYIAQGLSGTAKEGSDSQKITFGSASGDVRAQQFGADAIIGFKMAGGFLINANYDLGLSNDVNAVDGGSSKSHVFGVSVGYVFL